jgi:hypothetical protein
MAGESTLLARDRVARLPAPPAYLTIEDARRTIDDAFHFPPPITDVTLSGALTSAGGAHLELNSPSRLDGDSGMIDFLTSETGTCYGEVYVHLAGAVQGASYLGQLRCVADIAHGHEADASVVVNVFGGQGGSQFGRIMVRQRSLVVPFILSGAIAGQAWVAFNPVGLSNWHVYDVRVRKL